MPIISIVALKTLMSTGQSSGAFSLLASQLTSGGAAKAAAEIDPKLSRGKCLSVKTGMTPIQVTDILGSGCRSVASGAMRKDGKLYSNEMLEWHDGLHVVHCVFQNGKLTQKLQSDVQKPAETKTETQSADSQTSAVISRSLPDGNAFCRTERRSSRPPSKSCSAE